MHTARRLRLGLTTSVMACCLALASPVVGEMPKGESVSPPVAIPAPPASAATVAEPSVPAPPAAASPDVGTVEADIKQRLAEVAKIAQRDGDAAALAYTLETLRRVEAQFGAKHGYVGAVTRQAGGLLYRMKRYGESARAYLRALVVASQYFGLGHEQYRQAVGNVAASWMAADEPEQVIALYEHILKSPAANGGDTFDASY